jgi:hypothetical protein
MLTLGDMRELARARVSEAVLLIRSGHYDTAFYLCGYAVEVSLKARVCRTLQWAGFPAEPKEWERHHAYLKVHDLKLLAKWSGYELQLNLPANRPNWAEVTQWNPEARYRPAGTLTRPESIRMLRATRSLTELLNPP